MTNYLTEFGVLSPEHPLRKLAKLTTEGAPKDVKDRIMSAIHFARGAFMAKNAGKARGFHWDTLKIIDDLTPLFSGDPELADLLTQAYRVHTEAERRGPERAPGGARAPRRRAPAPDHRPGRPDRQRRPRGPLDEVAKTMLGLDLNEMYEMAATVLGTPRHELEAKYGHLNPGLQRMNLGNRMRKVQREAPVE